MAREGGSLQRGSLAAALMAAIVCAGAPGASPVLASDGAGETMPIGSSLPGSSFVATFRIESWLKQEIPGGDYAAELVRAYQERADQEAGFSKKGKRNWYDATAFYAKAQRIAQGEEVPPWAPHQLGLENPVLNAAYRATVRRSVRYRTAAPDACAQMVALFDHWIEQQRDGEAAHARRGRLFKQWAEAFRACSAPTEIFGFPIGECANTDNDRRLADAPERGRMERRNAQSLAEEIGSEEAAGVLELVGARIRLDGYASATGAGQGENSLGVCRAVFMKELLVVAGVDPKRIRVADKGLDGAGEAYRHRRVVLRQE